MHDTIFIHAGENRGAAITPDNHHHCFCTQDTGGNWVCCGCGMKSEPLSSQLFYPYVFGCYVYEELRKSRQRSKGER